VSKKNFGIEVNVSPLEDAGHYKMKYTCYRHIWFRQLLYFQLLLIHLSRYTPFGLFVFERKIHLSGEEENASDAKTGLMVYRKRQRYIRHRVLKSALQSAVHL
jgi:hypothetical protein